MARSSSSANDPRASAVVAGAAERVARYRQEAEKFRHLARTETDDTWRGTLLAIAKEYDDLADMLIPPE